MEKIIGLVGQEKAWAGTFLLNFFQHELAVKIHTIISLPVKLFSDLKYQRSSPKIQISKSVEVDEI